MTKQNTPTVRKALAGLTLLGALAVPLGGVAAASDGGGDRRTPSTSVAKEREQKKTTGATGARDGGGRSAATPAGLQASCSAQIARRLADLDKLAARVAAQTAVTPEHQAAITAILTATKTGLTALQAEIDAATTVDALQPLCARIVTDFRVYALVIPQVNVVLAADAIGGKADTFATLRLKLVDAIATGATPADEARLAELLASFDAHVAAMLAAVDGVADAALEVGVADYNADRKVLKPELEAVRTARKEAKAAARDAHRILEVIEGEDDDEHEDHPGSTTTAVPTITAAA